MQTHLTQSNKEHWKTGLIVLGLFILTVALMMVPSYQLLVKPRGEAFDLYWIWIGGRAVLAGENPYGPETTRAIQLGVFKKIIPPDQYQHGFPQPAHIAFILLPFVVMPFSWSALLWISLQIPLFMVILLLGFYLLNWSIRPSLLFPFAILTIFGFRYPINVYVLGQLIFFVLFCFLVAIWFYQNQHPRWAAIALACATIRPDLAIVAIALAVILVWNSPQRNEFVGTLLIAGLVLALIPALFIGFWPFIWINAIFSYGSNPFATWPPELLPPILAALLLTGLIIWAARYVVWSWHKPTPLNQSLMVSAVVLAGLIILPQTGSYNLTFALIPTLVFLRYARQRWLQITIVVSLLMPWLYFVLGNSFDRLIFLLIPAQFIIFQELVNYSKRPTA